MILAKFRHANFNGIETYCIGIRNSEKLWTPELETGQDVKKNPVQRAACYVKFIKLALEF